VVLDRLGKFDRPRFCHPMIHPAGVENTRAHFAAGGFVISREIFDKPDRLTGLQDRGSTRVRAMVDGDGAAAG
jgi:hypothetical protein